MERSVGTARVLNRNGCDKGALSVRYTAVLLRLDAKIATIGLCF